MIQFLAALGGSATLALIALTTWLTYKLVASKDQQLAARDMLDSAHEQLRGVEGDLKAETAAHAATTDELRKEKLLRASAEAERNEADRRARDQLVEEINASGIGDAIALGNRLLSRPLPGARLSETPGNDLEKP
jgi:hypothetical protein